LASFWLHLLWMEEIMDKYRIVQVQERKWNPLNSKWRLNIYYRVEKRLIFSFYITDRIFHRYTDSVNYVHEYPERL